MRRTYEEVDDDYQHLLPEKKKKPRPGPAGLDREILESALARVRQQMKDGLVASGHALVQRKDPTNGRFFRVRTGGWMVDKSEHWRVNGEEIRVWFSSSTKKHAHLGIDVNLFPFTHTGTGRAGMTVDLTASCIDLTPLINDINAIYEKARKRTRAKMAPEDIAACDDFRGQAAAAARLVREFLPSESIRERQDMLADGTWTLKLVTPATGTTVTASCDGLEIKTAPMAEDQARRLLMLCKEMGVLVTT